MCCHRDFVPVNPATGQRRRGIHQIAIVQRLKFYVAIVANHYRRFQKIAFGCSGKNVFSKTKAGFGVPGPRGGDGQPAKEIPW